MSVLIQFRITNDRLDGGLSLSNFAAQLNTNSLEKRKLHGSARTTYEQRKEIHESKLSNSELAKQYGRNVKTIAKWKNSPLQYDKQMGPKKGSFRAVSSEQRAYIENYCINHHESLDRCLVELQKVMPGLTRSTLSRIRKHAKENAPSTAYIKGQSETILQDLIRFAKSKGREILLDSIAHG